MCKVISSFILFTLILSFNSSFAQTHLTSQEAFNYYLKLTTQNKKDFVLEYIYQNDNDFYEKYWDDEFELNSKMKGKYLQMVESTKAFDLNSTYFVLLKTEIGTYDFEKNGFNFKPLEENSYFPVKPPTNKISCRICKTFTDIRLNFNNGNNIEFAPVEKNKARNLIKERRNSIGEVDRDVVLKIYFKPTDKIEENFANSGNIVDLHANIIKAEVLDVYGWQNRSGSGKAISTITLEGTKSISVSTINTDTESKNLEREKVKSYIENSLIDRSLKSKLIMLINNYE